MKRNLLILTLVGMLMGSAGFAQTPKKKVNESTAKSTPIKRKVLYKNTDHIGTWKLISQKITYENGQILTSDSSSVFLRKY